jgi:KipI family sensor histidine kinase inhibitor
MTNVRLVSYGAHALLAEYASLDEVMAAAAALRQADLSGVDEIVPAARTVLVHFREREPATLRDVLTKQYAAAPAAGRLVEIPVRYDGPDVDDVADALGMARDDVIDLHRSTVYTAAFCGFAPGFAYLSGLPPALHLPRRSTPRTLVPAGSLAMASEFTGVYPTASPGGWHLLGTVDVAMFDVHREPAALIAPGDRVRFVAR